MTDIFISYSSKDREWVGAFAGLLTAQGYEVWWDTSLLAGHDFQRTIPEKLDEAKCVIVVWTENSVESIWVRAEANRALNRKVLVPIQLSDTELPMPFGMVHTENFRKWLGKSEDVEFQRLLRALELYVEVDSSAVAQTEPGNTKSNKRRAKSNPDNFYKLIGARVWAILSVILVFGLVYVVNNTDEVWSWFSGSSAKTAAVDKTVQAQEMPKLLKGDQAPTSSVIAKPEQIGKVIELDHGMKLVKIPRGRFQMGSENGRDNEKPVHTVNIAYDFWMGETEVTFAQYDAYVATTGKYKPADNKWGRGRRPVINVSWDDAQGYVEWLSKSNEKLSCRLPSEAEWEYAARAGTQTKYFWGDDIGNNRANCNGCGSQWDGKQTAPVASFQPNQFSLYDMQGNVREWVQDQLFNDYQGAPADGSARNPKPEGNGILWNHIFRGGSWDFSPQHLRSANRNYGLADYRHFNLGFRVACVAR